MEQLVFSEAVSIANNHRFILNACVAQITKDLGLDWYIDNIEPTVISGKNHNLDFWNDPIARKYSIRAIPQSYLVDKNGVVIGKNLRGNDLEEKIKFALSLND